MAKIQFARGTGYRLKGDPQQIGECLESVRRKKGLTPQIVVAEASHPRSPLHGEFEWDDAVAAEQYRLEHARYLLRAIVLVRKPQNGDPRFVRAFVSIDDQAGPCYMSINVAMGDPVLRKMVLERAWRELEGWRERYREYEELAAVFSLLDQQRRKAG